MKENARKVGSDDDLLSHIARSSSKMPRLAIYLVAALLFFAAIRGAGVTEEKTLRVTEQQNGAEIRLKKDQTLVIELSAQPGTGYGWQVARADGVHIKPAGKSDASGEQQPGGVSRQRFQFAAGQPGTTTLELRYARRWEQSKKPAKTYVLKIRVEE
jgi:inhibitor of cysteine peptidase